jgi:hypothetical protein
LGDNPALLGFGDYQFGVLIFSGNSKLPHDRIALRSSYRGIANAIANPGEQLAKLKPASHARRGIARIRP